MMKAIVRKFSRLLTVALTVCLVLTYGAPVDVSAAEDVPVREYTIRFFAGQRGNIVDRETGAVSKIKEIKRKAGYQISASDFFAQRDASVTDEKYYVRGIRESGKDFKEEEEGKAVSSESQYNANPSMEVTQDIDYVVSYGILGDSVAYTVNYLDGAGNALLPSETYYGNVGDRPVIAYQYIEGWLPQAYNLTRTLSDDPSENVFDFVYTRVATGTAAPAPGPAAGGAGAGAGAAAGTGTAGTGAGAAGTGAGAGAGDAGAGDAGAGAGAGAGEEGAGAGAGEDVDIPDEAAPQGEGPQDLVDLDDQDTPLASFADGVKNILNPEGDGVMVKVVRPIAGVGLAALLGFLFFLLYKRRKKEKEETGGNG